MGYDYEKVDEGAPKNGGEVKLPDKEEPQRDRWGNKVEFLLASIGLAVGTGNVWRFPYLAQKNGGGAFLIPYFIMLLVEGLPLFYLELALGQRMQKGYIRIWGDIRPYFKGLGIGQLLVSFNMTAYFPMVMSWCMYYFYLSFFNPLPWTPDQCLSNASCCSNDSAKYFWYEETLEISPSLEENNGLVPGIAGCWVVGWVLTYLCLFKGVKSSGKAAYFTATFPYVVLLCLFFRGVTLEGAAKGILVFFKPDFNRLLDPTVWMDAAGQIFYSLSIGFGALICFGSYNPVKNNCSMDAMIIALINCGTSLFAGIVVYSVLGFRETTTGILVEDVEGGPGLAFIAYTTAVAEMPLPQLWAAMFFFMMVLLAIDSEFGTIEAIVSPLHDFKIFERVRKEILCLILCVTLCLLGLPCCCRNGLYVFSLWDQFSVSLPLLFIGVIECVVIGWFYGIEKFSNDIEYMTGSQPNIYWKICWKWVSPVLITVVLLASIIKQCFSPATYSAYVGCVDYPLSPLFNGTDNWMQSVPFPWWAQIIAAVMVLVPVLPIFIVGLFNIRTPHTQDSQEMDKI